MSPVICGCQRSRSMLNTKQKRPADECKWTKNHHCQALQIDHVGQTDHRYSKTNSKAPFENKFLSIWYMFAFSFCILASKFIFKPNKKISRQNPTLDICNFLYSVYHIDKLRSLHNNHHTYAFLLHNVRLELTDDCERHTTTNC